MDDSKSWREETATMFSHLIVAYIFIFICLGLIGLGIILLFLMKISQNKEQQLREMYEQKHHDYFVYIQTHLEDEKALRLPPGKLKPLERRVIQDKYMEWIEQFKGEYRAKMIQLCRDAGLVEEDLKALKSFRYGRRLGAAYRLGGMRAGEAVPALLQMLQKGKYNSLLIIIARSIAKSAQRPEDVIEMLRTLLSHGKPIHHLAADIMLETGLDTSGLLMKLLDDQDPALVKVGLVAMWGQAVPEVMPVLGRLVGSEEKDVRAEAVKLYLSSNPTLKDETIVQLMSDRNWEVRAAAAKALGPLHAAGSIPLLVKALQDANWKVRHSSAESLAALGEAGFEALCQAALSGAGIQREAALQRIELVMEKKQEHSAIEQMVAYNKKRLIHDRYFGVKQQPIKRMPGIAAVGGDYTA
ncbi:HEAT repeat domain-containing protein [Paenibacillus sp. KQZ6P-2]|uniref:HEAT repeat domain-containing protein n=1 Tax=Paenibacillus mangrovi TaxID=2931978 RepID=A0A9X2B1H9_9BACL|nr:HEAT repeat domain-containing protein [Paenibacillus mangrovi]MCJ8011251.1 HEAT repeat domain-containing protein [Paenibacillus mangrovi]